MKNETPTLTRRGFLKASALIGGGLVLEMSLLTTTNAKTTKTEPWQPNAFLRIGADDNVTVVIKHLEMGQGTYTGLATLVADELDANWDNLKVESAPADTQRYKNLLWGMQGTGGSSAIKNSFLQMRNAGASARLMLVRAAATKWAVDESEITVNSGIIKHKKTGKQANFGALAELAIQQDVPLEVKLKDPKDFKLIGKDGLVRKDNVDKTTGAAQYTQDVNLPDMLTALVAHPPKFGAKVASFDAKQALTMPGVKNVLQIPTGVAVLATDFWSAKKARDALVIKWDYSEAFTLSSAQIMTKYKSAAEEEGKVAIERGELQSAAKQTLSADFEFPYLAHAAMEPMNCVVDLQKKRCDIYYGAQMQTSDQMQIAQLFDLKPEQVFIHTLYAGGSFGRRANPHADYVLEAAQIAKANKSSNPVKLVWTREDDMRAGFYRPMYLHRIEAGIDQSGNISHWNWKIVGQSIAANTSFAPFMIKDGIDATSVEGASNFPYQIDNFKVTLTTPTDIKVPVLWWRSVGSTHTAYAGEVMLDRLAKAAGRDPVDFRMNMLTKHPRHSAVLQLAADKAGWKKPLAKGQFRGVAVHESFSSYVAQVAEISIDDDGKVKVERVVCAVDCGIAVNPDIIRAQVEGSISFGLSATLASNITLEDGGQVKQSNFHDYTVLRMLEMPKVEVHIITSAEAPTGIGEPAVPPIAPAVANALYAANGKDYNVLPLPIG